MDGRRTAILDDVLNRALMGSRLNEFLSLRYSDRNMLICSDFGMGLLNSNQRLAAFENSNHSNVPTRDKPHALKRVRKEPAGCDGDLD